MSLIFSRAGLRDARPPCVLQSFVNHGAVLHKVFVVGEQHFTVERPSLKNFPTGPYGECALLQSHHGFFLAPFSVHDYQVSMRNGLLLYQLYQPTDGICRHGQSSNFLALNAHVKLAS